MKHTSRTCMANTRRNSTREGWLWRHLDPSRVLPRKADESATMECWSLWLWPLWTTWIQEFTLLPETNECKEQQAWVPLRLIAWCWQGSGSRLSIVEAGRCRIRFDRGSCFPLAWGQESSRLGGSCGWQRRSIRGDDSLRVERTNIDIKSPDRSHSITSNRRRSISPMYSTNTDSHTIHGRLLENSGQT